MQMTGACACGSLRWRAEGEPLTQGICHCRTCQRISGSGHIGWITYPESAVTIMGDTRSISRTGGSGLVAKRFSCPTCNSTVYGTAEVIAGRVNLYAGSLDDPSQFNPTIAIFVSERPAWDDASRGLTCFETVPSS